MHLLYATVAYLMNRNVRRSGTARTAVSPVKREGVHKSVWGALKKQTETSRATSPSQRHRGAGLVNEGMPREVRGDAQMCRQSTLGTAAPRWYTHRPRDASTAGLMSPSPTVALQ